MATMTEKEKKPPPTIKDPVYSDIYNAEIFYELVGNKIKWCKDLGGWFIFNGKYWERDANDAIKKEAIEVSKAIAIKMMEIGYKAMPNYKRIQSNPGLLGMIECAKAFMGCMADDFDRNENLFNCLNGTYDLYGNNFKSFSSNDLLTKTGHVEYKLMAECPLWIKFLNEIFLEDQDLINYIQRVIGYSMTASVKEQCMFIFHGHGRNGKSRFIDTISHIMGDYATNCPSSTFVLKQNPGIPNDVARLKGTRFASASETNQNVNLDEELIKQLTGNKVITARFLNREYFDFAATFKIFLATNHKPNIRGTDTGIWRRIQMIPFRLNVTEEKEDKSLGDKLLTESSGILNWMIEGHNKWLKEGLNTPEIVRRSTQLYREEEDDLGQFIKQECMIEKGEFIQTKEFRDKFYHIMGYHKSAKSISEYMTRHGFKPHGDNKIMYKGKQQRGYIGIRFANDADRIEDKGWQE